MPGFMNNFYSTGGAALIVAGIISIALGILEAFWGYRLFKIQVALIALLAGFFFGFILGESFFSIYWLAIVIGILVGALCAFLAIKFFKVGEFLVVGFFAFLLGISLTNNIWLGLLFGIVGGVLGIFFTKPLIIIATAFGGAGLVASGIGTLFWGSPQLEPMWLHWIILLFIGVGGALVQFRNTRNIE